MADEGGCSDIHLLKRTKISVYVDEALPDILVVTFEFGVKIFKGVLLDSTKKSIPCGIPNLNPAFSQPAKTSADDDTLYSVNQRFAYTDPANAKKKNVHISTKYKNSKMTVRLRPRQVLCTKCKGICNENSENVTRKRKPSETVHSPPPPIKRGANAPITRSVNNTTAAAVTTNETGKKRIDPRRTLIPKSPPELPPHALSGNVNKLNIDNNKRPPSSVPNNNHACDSNVENNALDAHSLVEHSSDGASRGPDAKLRRGLRKKRSIGSVEDAWDESKNAAASDQPPCSNTRTIKISFGPQGEGTVLKIPAQIENLSADDDLGENVDAEEAKEKDSQKAARKAMKKARKEAKRKTVLPNSPERMSPRCAVGASSPRYTVGSASPRHGLGGHSPRYVSAATLDASTPRKRKHKMKHKKRHREDKDRRHGREGEVQERPCLTQKLSINLKRLSASYTSMQMSANERTEGSSSDEQSEQVPDFPPSNPPPLLRLNGSSMASAPGADGVRLTAGDVVWGKIHGFPWWPGKVLTITNYELAGPQAHVAWYGSSTSSLMQCDQLSPYLDNFKIRYNKKKRGPYKEAIRQASDEARVHAAVIKSSPALSIIPAAPPALASPREINVIS